MFLRRIDEFAMRIVHTEYGYANPGLRSEDIIGSSTKQAAQNLFARLSTVREQVANLNEGDWLAKFEADVHMKRQELELIWEARWLDICDGKRLFEDLKSQLKLNISIRVLKQLIIREMRSKERPNWLTMKGELENLLRTTQNTTSI